MHVHVRHIFLRSLWFHRQLTSWKYERNRAFICNWHYKLHWLLFWDAFCRRSKRNNESWILKGTVHVTPSTLRFCNDFNYSTVSCTILLKWAAVFYATCLANRELNSTFQKLISRRFSVSYTICFHICRGAVFHVTFLAVRDLNSTLYNRTRLKNLHLSRNDFTCCTWYSAAWEMFPLTCNCEQIENSILLSMTISRLC